MSVRDLIPWGRQTNNVPARYRDEEANPVMSLHRNVNRLIDEAFRDAFSAFGGGWSRSIATWPNLEVDERDNEIRVTAEVPGMTDKDVELLVDDGVLTIRGERKSETNDQERGYSERFYGRFERRVALPTNVDEVGAKAEFRDGVLTVTLPKSPQTERARRIPINAPTRH
jgi:HSP20 family protein